MLQSAIAEAREQNFREVRLATGNPAAAKLFEEVGFVRLQDDRWWKGMRIEGIRLLEKQGGKSGHFRADDHPGPRSKE